MTNFSELVKTAIDASKALQQSLSPALSGNAQIDAEQLVEQHRQLSATIAELLKEIAQQYSEASNQVVLQTEPGPPINSETLEIISRFSDRDKRIFLGLAELQQKKPESTGFTGNEIHRAEIGGFSLGNCSHRLNRLVSLVPNLLSHQHEKGKKIYRLTDDGLKCARILESRFSS